MYKNNFSATLMHAKLKKYINVFALLMITVFVTYNTYTNNHPILKNELFCIAGVLKEAPYLGKQGGDMPEPYIELLLENSKKKYFLMYCSYYASRKEDILELTKGSTVQIYVKKNDKNRRKPDIFELTSMNKKLLSLSDFNTCHTERWKGLLICIYILTGLLIVMPFIDLFKYLLLKIKK